MLAVFLASAEFGGIPSEPLFVAMSEHAPTRKTVLHKKIAVKCFMAFSI